MKFCCAMFAAAAIILLMIGAAMADTGDFEFAGKSDGSGYVVTGYTGSDATVTVPDWYNGLPVVEIGAAAFRGNTTIRIVKLPSSIKKIASSAFNGCKKLEKVTDYVAASEPPEDVHLPGDSDHNGKVEAYDALLLLQFDAGWKIDVPDADVTYDGVADRMDAVRILRYLAGEIPSLGLE